MAELQTIIRSAAAELGDKVAELQRQDKLVRDLQAQQVTAARVQTCNVCDVLPSEFG